MLGGLRDALLPLKSHLLLVKDVVAVLLLLCGGRWAGRFWKVGAAEAVLSRDWRRAWRVQRALSLGENGALVWEISDILLLLKEDGEGEEVSEASKG
jgi:hypothetical protein